MGFEVGEEVARREETGDDAVGEVDGAVTVAKLIVCGGNGGDAVGNIGGGGFDGFGEGFAKCEVGGYGSCW